MGKIRPKASRLCKICGNRFTQFSPISTVFRSPVDPSIYVAPCPSCANKCYDDLKLREASGELVIAPTAVKHLDKKALLFDFKPGEKREVTETVTPHMEVVVNAEK